MTRSSKGEPTLKEKVKWCHCGASFLEWSILRDFTDYSLYHICPRCLCSHQKLTVNPHGDQIWVNLPVKLFKCPKIGRIRKCHLLIKELIFKLSELLKNLADQKDPYFKDMEKLLKQGWKLRRKKIKGRSYAYLQLGKKYRYIGPWKEEYEKK